MKSARALPRRLLLAGGCAAALLLGACSTTPSSTQPSATSAGFWSGRLAVQVQAASAHEMQNSSLSAGFELRGNARAGSLQLFTPLGSSVARMQWTPQGAVLEQSGSTRSSPSLEALVQETLGTAIPIDALFQWLQGTAQTPEGWEVDLSRHAEGRISANRFSPLPQAQLRIVLDR